MYRHDPDSIAAVAADEVSRSAAVVDAPADKHTAKPAASLTGEIIRREISGSAAPDGPRETTREPDPEADAGELDMPTWRPDASPRLLGDDWDGPANSTYSTYRESWWKEFGLPSWSNILVFVLGYLVFLAALVFGLDMLPAFLS